MEIIKLPAVLPGDLDLVEVNGKLRSSAAKLDWSAVASVNETHLATLLAGVSTDREEFGNLDEASDEVTQAVARYLASRPVERVSSEGSAVEDYVPTPLGVRDQLEAILIRDLLGPAGGEDEEVTESVRDRYLVGVLAPKYRKFSPEIVLDEDLEVAGDDSPQEGKPDQAAAPTDSMLPSSMGLTFCVEGDEETIRVRARWGRYERTESKTLFNDKGAPARVWKRVQMDAVSADIRLKEGNLREWTPSADFPDVTVRGIARRMHGDWIVSVFLINGQRETERLGNAMWIFQPELTVESVAGRAVFIRRTLGGAGHAEGMPDSDIRMMRMAYRRHVEFAVGHNVGVHAEPSSTDSERAARVSTAVVPRYEVPKTTPPTIEEIPDLEGLELDMFALADTPAAELPAKLEPLVRGYEAWLNLQRERINDPSEGLSEFRETALAALERGVEALGRIREGIEVLRMDPQAAEAFRFANRAVGLQRVRTLYAEQRRRGKNVELADVQRPENHRWFPFQLAFILLNLPGTTRLDHPDRSEKADAVADLLWFPTGGGKTEAYLGLTAYVLGIRRLQGNVEGRAGEYGVAVLMRYTLRLLTLQQFQRATALICACEEIRRGDDRWGAEPFRIGLWVGQKTTPNRTADSAATLDKTAYQGAGVGSPHQLTCCPWCGTEIDKGRDIMVEPFPAQRGRTLVFCGDKLGRCAFSRRNSPDEGLPVLVVDEEIYRLLPALLIATVDKFAQMPWEGRTQMLFGQVNGRCPRHGFRSPEVDDSDSHPAKGNLPAVKTQSSLLLRPPDLVIQDELHLISGPLGTLVGLYETAIDRLASWEVNGKVVRPKVIASTATIRNAADQVHGLFMRRVRVFPPPGLDADDNFFSRRRPPSEAAPGRVYLGICAPGRKLKSALIRAYVALLGGSQSLYERYGERADPYMTTVGYFNSVRELAGMRRLTDDDVTSRLKRIDRRGLARRINIRLEELTSRRSSVEIPMILDRLETPFDRKRAAENEARRKAGQKPEGRDPLDVLLATNMISVGVDVRRLGAMIVAGQPKATAEYIQATSRVGRSTPGLVLTVFNWARPRDLSHYEKFEHYQEPAQCSDQSRHRRACRFDGLVGGEARSAE